MDEQERHLNAIGHQRDEQLERLRALNSPLPSPIQSPPTLPPAYQTQRTANPTNFQPQKQPGNFSSPRGNPLDLLNDVKQDAADELRAVDGTSSMGGIQNAGTEKTNGSTPSVWGGFFGGGNKSKDQQQPSIAAVRKGPIRMELPLGEEDPDTSDVDVESAMQRIRKRGSKDQDERSKKWGIDISKFND